MKKLPKRGLKKNFKEIIGIIGVGYVGLPLAINFSKFFKTLAYDNNKKRISELRSGIDRNLDFNKKQLKKKNLEFINQYNLLRNCNNFIITLPTPLNKKDLPDLKMVLEAVEKLSKIIKKKDFIIFESTFFPGTVENILIPIIEKLSKLKCGSDFHVGYSPERINPGDKKHKLENIKKIISSNSEIGKTKIKYLYKKIIKAGLHEVSSIKSAELVKLLENSQRYVNIALINQISTLCNKINIQTKEVIDAAASKWNFMKFFPGLVGGHCVAVDPLYLSFTQKKLGLSSSLVDVSKKINDKKINEVTNYIIKENRNKKLKILLLGATFKENCPDFRNSGALSIIKSLNIKKIIPDLHDPYMKYFNRSELDNYKFKKIINIKPKNYDCIVISVAHKIYKDLNYTKIKKFSLKKSCRIYDLKSIFPKDKVHFQL